MAKFLVVGLQSFNFKDDSGRTIKGNNIYFLDKSDREDYRGLKTGKISVSDNLLKAFTVLPGFYDLDFSVRVGAGGKTVATISSVEFISAVNFEGKQVTK
jgi:hypothetical protein